APIHPCVFFLGGGKISDAFSMMRNVLTNGKADRILTGGITADVMLLASGVELGVRTRTFLAERDLTGFIAQAKELLQTWPDRFLLPVDCAYERDGERAEATTDEIARAAELQQHLFVDLGEQTIASYVGEIERAGSVFVNGPAGIYEDARFERGTEKIWQAIASAPGYTVVGGGDTITAAKRFTTLDDFSYVCTAGGAMIRFLSGKKMPLIEAMERAWERDRAQKEKQ
ncbi:MAG TPA: phosphoglycerate kinase, partial [Sphaerochaeta sp.]|nr:phosphoglycerate kinase [Sphaerochaeta sp.]HOQ95385.1 phosphoglycerate kinase [Sphaerochaeta sp.]